MTEIYTEEETRRITGRRFMAFLKWMEERGKSTEAGIFQKEDVDGFMAIR